MIADLGRELNRDDLAVMVAKIARDKGVDNGYLYPLRSVPAGSEPEPALTLAIIRQESAFQLAASSPPRARPDAAHARDRQACGQGPQDSLPGKQDLTRSADYDVCASAVPICSS